MTRTVILLAAMTLGVLIAGFAVDTGRFFRLVWRARNWR